MFKKKDKVPNMQKEHDLGSDDITKRLEHTEELEAGAETVGKLRKKRGFWRRASLASLFLFLVTILCACASEQSSHTIITDKAVSDSETEISTESKDEPMELGESIKVYGYVVKSVGLTPDYTGNTRLSNNGGNDATLAAMADYEKNCSIIWDIEDAEADFTAFRQSDGQPFVSGENETASLASGNLLRCDGWTPPEVKEDMEVMQDYVAVEKSVNPDGYKLKSMGVILPNGTTKSEIQAGVSSLLQAINGLQDNGLALDENFSVIKDFKYRIADLSLEDMANMAGEAFGGTGCTVFEQDGGQVLVQRIEESGRVSVESELLKDGDVLIYFTLDRYGFTNTAAQYSKILQGTYDGVVFEH